jgi:lactate dehydrogenase-like 2-hydroxyacid dehydrogenase
MTLPRVWVTGPVAEAALAPLREVAEVSMRRAAERPEPAEMLQAVRGLTGLIPVNGARVDAAVLDAAGPSLRVVANFAVGYDNLDVPACTARGVLATNTPDVLTEATADVAFGLILAAARRFGEGELCAREGRWAWAQALLWGQDVGGATLGIVGMGRIGAAVARRSLGFGMRLLYYSRRRKPELEAALHMEYRPFEELLAQADILSLHCALTPETRHLLNAAALARMKPTAIVVNSGRGGLIDQPALLEAVRAGRLAGAGLDVTDPEPPALDDPILHEPRIVVTPHIGSASFGGRTGMTRVAAANVLAVLRGERAPNLLNPEALERAE